MLDRRESPRDKVIYGGIAEIGEDGASRDCVVRNISETGASLEFKNAVRLPNEQISLTIARKGRSFLARIIWWRDNFVGVAFSGSPPSSCRCPMSRSGCARASRRNGSFSARSKSSSAGAENERRAPIGASATASPMRTDKFAACQELTESCGHACS